MFETVAGWSMTDSALFFRTMTVITLMIFAALCFLQIGKAHSAGGFESEGDTMVMVTRVIVFVLIILITIVYSY